MGTTPKRIDKSLVKLIEKKQKDLITDTGVDISFPDASRILAHEILELKTGRKFNKKELSLFDL